MIALLLALYPARWRRRYGEEFRAMLESRPLGPFDVADILLGALDARLTRFRLVGVLGAEGGHVMMLRIGGLAAIGGGIIWFIGFALSSSGFEPATLSRILMLIGSVGILVALAGLSAFQAHGQPRLAWAAFGIPALGLLASIAGIVAWELVPEDQAIFAGLNPWSLWILGILTTVIGSILFGIATLRAEVLSRGAAAAMVASAVFLLLVAFGFFGPGGDAESVRIFSALSIGSFAASWVALGITALRRGPIRAIAPA